MKNTSKRYRASAPGSLMLFGEHAVLYGGKAIVAALDKRITVTLKMRTDDKVILHSDLAADFKNDLKELKNFSWQNAKKQHAWRFVLAAIFLYRDFFKSGFELNIKADFASDLGFGSSAAVTVATLAVLHHALKQTKISEQKLLQQVILVVQKVQGTGSGADCAASIYGGIVAYQMQPLKAKKIAKTLPLTVVYSGNKVATPIVVAQIKKLYQKKPKLVKQIFTAIDVCAEHAEKAILERNFVLLGFLMDVHQSFQEDLQVSNDVLGKIIIFLRQQKGIYGAKISGAGLGDAVVALGKLKQSKVNLNGIPKARLIKIAIGRGIRYH